MQEKERSQREHTRSKKPLQRMAEEISQSLLLEMEQDQGVERSPSVNILDHLVKRLADEVVSQLGKAGSGNGLSDEVVSQLGKAGSGNGSSDEQLEARLQKMERRLEKMAVSAGDGDEAKTAETGNRLPNLKYAKPKYKNVESMLKYIESDDDKGGVKLVIMNFND